jgi:hypothetical protein
MWNFWVLFDWKQWTNLCKVIGKKKHFFLTWFQLSTAPAGDSGPGSRPAETQRDRSIQFNQIDR